MNSQIMVRDFTVDLALIGMAAVSAMLWRVFADRNVVARMPRATVSEGKLYFFRTGHHTLVGEVDAEYAKHGLVPVDMHTLCAFNAANPEFVHFYRNGTQCKIDDSFYCVGFFGCSINRSVGIDKFSAGDCWDDGWWLAGVENPAEADK